jgi:gamma-glutamylputrescine oxidase
MSYADSYYSRTMNDPLNADVLSSDCDAKVCVIGGGLAGLSTALGLAERGVSVVLLEAEQVGWGASGRNGGFVSSGFSKSALELAASLGEDHAKRLYQLTQQAFDLVQARIATTEETIAQDQTGTLTVSWFDDAPGVRHYVDEMQRIFGEELEFWPREKVNAAYLTKRYYDGFLKPKTLRFQSLNYALHVARMAVNKGASIFEQSPVNRVTPKGDRWCIETDRARVNADHVVYATSGYIGSLHGKLSRATLPVATYVLLTEPLGDKLQTAVRSPYGVSDNRFSSTYYRVVGDQQLLWGGRVSMFQPRGDKLKRLMVNDLLSVYPQLAGVRGQVAWGGLMGYARHKMPQIGHLRPGEWYCQGFGGHGMVTTTMGGELVAAAIASDDERFRLFEPFGLDYVGKPFGPVIAQLAYWSYQLQDALQVSRLNRKF